MFSRMSLWVTLFVFMFVGAVRVSGVNLFCCQSTPNDPGCSGCLRQYSGPQSIFVHVGNNATSKCQPTAAPASCDTQSLRCVYLVDVDVHDDAACSHVIGVMTLELGMEQCDNSDSPCGSG